MKLKCAKLGCMGDAGGQLFCKTHRKKQCRIMGCTASTETTLCEPHLNEQKARIFQERSARERAKPGGDLYNTTRWQKMRAIFKSKHILCAANILFDRPVVATDVDHIVAHGGNLAFFFNHDNLQYLCKGSHTEKTSLEKRGIICDYVNNVQCERGRYREINPSLPYDKTRLEQLLIRKERVDGTI